MTGNSEPIPLAFEFERATKNTHKYSECPDPCQPPRIGTLYVQKWALPAETPPRAITLTLEVVQT